MGKYIANKIQHHNSDQYTINIPVFWSPLCQSFYYSEGTHRIPERSEGNTIKQIYGSSKNK